MDNRLTGRVAVVTGSAQGIGQAIAIRLADDGAAVALVDRSGSKETQALIAERGGQSIDLPADVSDEESVRAVVDEAEGILGGCAVLVNNAGIGRLAPLADITLAAWREVIAVNLESQFLTCRAILPGMRSRGWGRVINIASNTVGLVLPGGAHYIASKAGVIGLTRAIASEFGPFGITANVIAPGLTRTPLSAIVPEEDFAATVAAQPVRRTGMPADMVGTVAFLASDDSAFLTAQTLYVDGGLVRG